MRHAALGCSMAALACAFGGCSEDDSTAPAALPDAGVSADGAPEASTGANTDRAPKPWIGLPCGTDEDCIPPSYCISPSDTSFDRAGIQGGPPNGICSLDCTPRTGADGCAGASNPSTCVTIDGVGTPTAICLPTCTVGEDSPGKCLDRGDLACVHNVLRGDDDYCDPRCEADYQCGEGRCDLGSGLCTLRETRSGIAPIGAPCDAHFDCASRLCVDFGVASACSGECPFGTFGCGFDPLSTEPLDAVCLFGVEANAEIHDAGLCGQLCDCQDDCRHPDAYCQPVGEDSLLGLAVRGRRGVCVFQWDPTVPIESIPCTSTDDAGARDAAGADSSGAG